MPEDTTQAPEATTTPAAPEAQPETFEREYVEKLRKENATYRRKAQEAHEAVEAAKTAAERAKLDELERVKAEKADVEKRIAELELRSLTAERRAAITGKVADATAALKLLDETRHLDQDGAVKVDALLTDYPFLAPKALAGSSIPAPDATKTINAADLQRMTPEEINKNWDAVKAAHTKP